MRRRAQSDTSAPSTPLHPSIAPEALSGRRVRSTSELPRQRLVSAVPEPDLVEYPPEEIAEHTPELNPFEEAMTRVDAQLLDLRTELGVTENKTVRAQIQTEIEEKERERGLVVSNLIEAANQPVVYNKMVNPNKEEWTFLRRKAERQEERARQLEKLKSFGGDPAEEGAPTLFRSPAKVWARTARSRSMHRQVTPPANLPKNVPDIVVTPPAETEPPSGEAFRGLEDIKGLETKF